MRALCLTFFILGFFASSSMVHADEAPLSDSRKAEFGEIIKSYLLEHPEVIQDALNELEKRQRDAETNAQKAALATVGPDLIKSENGIVLGNPSGDVTLVEFFDYNCGYCKKSLADIMTLMKDDPKLRVILRDFPVLGPDSIEASKVALAVRAQLSGAKYMEFHQKLLESRGRVGKDRALQVAQELGADMAKLQKDLDSTEVRRLIEGTMHAADALRIGGTPAFVVGDGVIVGAVGHGPLADAVKSMRSCGKAVC